MLRNEHCVDGDQNVEYVFIAYDKSVRFTDFIVGI
jgi:hypothetical protein